MKQIALVVSGFCDTCPFFGGTVDGRNPLINWCRISAINRSIDFGSLFFTLKTWGGRKASQFDCLVPSFFSKVAWAKQKHTSN